MNAPHVLTLASVLGCAPSAEDSPTAAAAPAEASAALEAPTPPPVAAPPPKPGGTPIVADLHIDTPTQLLRRGVGLDAPELESGLGAMRAGGTNLAMMVLWPPKAPGDAVVASLLERMEAEDARLDAVALARSPAEARRVVADGRVAFAYAMEGAHGLDAAGVEGLAPLQARGLAMIGVTWSFSNTWGGSSKDEGGGLTERGRALVTEANRLGVVLDVSHASRATTLDICRLSSAPVVASHSDAAAVHGNPRNLDDEEIACVCEKGGVIGLNFHAPFVGPGAGATTLGEHADHLAKVGGRGCVALGSDFDGMITPPPDLRTAASLDVLWTELARRGWSPTEIAGVKGENFMRVWERATAGVAE